MFCRSRKKRIEDISLKANEMLFQQTQGRTNNEVITTLRYMTSDGQTHKLTVTNIPENTGKMKLDAAVQHAQFRKA